MKITKNILLISSEEKANCVNLFPKFDSKCKYSFEFSEYTLLISAITRFSDNIARFLSEKQFNEIKATPETKYRFIRPYVGILSYILIDRYLRILKLQNYFKDFTLKGNNENNDFLICRNRNILEAYARDNSDFNQYIINNLLCNHIPTNSIYINTNNWDFYTGFKFEQNKPKLSYIKPFKNNDYKGKIIATRLAYISDIMKKEYNDLLLINELMDINININSFKYNKIQRKEIKKDIKSFFNKEIKKILKLMNIENNCSIKIDTSLLNLFFDLYPISGLEGSLFFFNEAKDIIHYLEPNAYIEGFLSFVFEDAIYINAACNFFNIPVYGIQHSGRGGYIGNCPYVSEYSQNCSDFYITSGWKHIEKHLPYPKNGLISLPSINFSLKKDTYKIKKQNQILICLGEIFSYPVVYDASYTVDTRYVWYETMINLIKKLLNYEYKILIRSYCELSYKTHQKLFDDIKLLNSEKIEISKDFRKGVAKEYFDNSILVIWDILSGGFIESVLYKIPTIVVASEKQVAYQEEALSTISKLKEAYLLIENIEFVDYVLDSLNNKFYNEKKESVLKEFFQEFVSLNPQWKEEWLSFLKKLAKKEY